MRKPPHVRYTGHVRWEMARLRGGVGRRFRASVGPVEISVQGGWLDLCLPGQRGTVLFGIIDRTPTAENVEGVRRRREAARAGGPAFPSRFVLANTRPLHVGLLGTNIAEVGVAWRTLLVTWVENDMHYLAPGAVVGYHPDTEQPLVRT